MAAHVRPVSSDAVDGIHRPVNYNPSSCFVMPGLGSLVCGAARGPRPAGDSLAHHRSAHGERVLGPVFPRLREEPD